jgi:hypothetical protein
MFLLLAADFCSLDKYRSEKSYKKRISRSMSTMTKRITMTNKDDFSADCMFDEGDGPGKKALGLWWAASGEDGVDRQAARQRRRYRRRNGGFQSTDSFSLSLSPSLSVVQGLEKKEWYIDDLHMSFHRGRVKSGGRLFMFDLAPKTSHIVCARSIFTFAYNVFD